MLFLIFLNILYASTFTLSKILLKYGQPVFLTAARMLLSGATLLLFHYIIAKKDFKNVRLKKKDLWPLLQIIFFGNFISYVFEFIALKDMPSLKVAFLYNLTPFVMAIISYIYLKEKISLKKWLGLIISIVGCIPILIEQSPSEELVSGLLFISWSELILIAGIVAYAYSWQTMRKLIHYEDQSPIIVNYLTMIGGGLIALPLGWYFEGIFPVNNVMELAFWLTIMIIVSNIVFYYFYGSLLKKYSATFISLTTLSCPIITAFFGVLFLGEKITYAFIFANVLVFAGLYLYYTEE
ncbi:DMT family transporter [Candidatus Dependentiae bacterium]|nr:DMT family transporter [Candidatus Dependentiae bacterium]